MDKRGAIISAATELFANQGFEGTPMLQIAREAGVTEALVYYHFKDKEELLSTVV